MIAATMAGPPAVDETKAGALITALNWLYDKIAAPQSTALVDHGASCENQIDRWIAVACTTAGTAGFVTNMGGVLTLPIALPANLLSVATIQIRLITEIAACRGYDVRSPQVRAAALACLAGNAAIDALKEAGIQVGQRLGQQLIAQIAGATLLRVNKAVGFRLLAKAGSQGVVNLTKVVPVLGGLVGGGVDALSTKAVGAISKRVFVRIDPAVGPVIDVLAIDLKAIS